MNGDNALDEEFVDWLTKVFIGQLHAMPPEQRQSIECAFYAGASSGRVVAAKHGEIAVVESIMSHRTRIRGWSGWPR